MIFARWVFLFAGTYGILVLAPGLFAPPPAGVAPEFYFGFIGSALVWQCAFFLIARDPVRFRQLMLVAMLEKLAFFATCAALFSLGEMQMSLIFVGGMIDGVWLALFALAWRCAASRP